jgi:hypothetical protein
MISTFFCETNPPQPKEMTPNRHFIRWYDTIAPLTAISFSATTAGLPLFEITIAPFTFSKTLNYAQMEKGFIPKL